MSSAAPPRDWTAIDWTDVDAATAARWIAVLPLAATEQHGPHLPLETDVMIGEAYLARVRELLPDAVPVTFLPDRADRHLDRAHRFSGNADAVDGSGAREVEAIGESVARRGREEARHRHQPWRQQRGDDAGGAGSARPSRHARGHHLMVALRRAGRIVSRRRNCATAFTAARSRPRSCWRDIREQVRVDAIADFPSRQHRDGENNIAGCRRNVPRHSPGRRRIFIRAARSAMRRSPRPRKARRCSTTARAGSSNCSRMSINST